MPHRKVLKRCRVADLPSDRPCQYRSDGLAFVLEGKELMKLKQSVKQLKERFNITPEKINKAITEFRQEETLTEIITALEQIQQQTDGKGNIRIGYYTEQAKVNARLAKKTLEEET